MAPSSGASEKGSPRLIDYVVFVGQRNPSRNGSAISQPELLRVYPPQNHTDFALPNDIVYFCQPEGCYNTSSRSFILDPRHSGGRLPQNIKVEFFTFMLTDKESNTVRFGVCLNFLRPIGRRKSSYTAHVARRRITSFKSALQHPESKVEHNRLRSCDNYEHSSTSSDSSEFVGGHIIGKPERPYTHTLTSICLVSRYQFFKKFQECLRFLYVLIQKLHEVCKPRRSGRQTVWSVLTGAIESSTLLTVRKSVEEIDTWILRLLSLPAPLAGKTAVHVYLQPSTPTHPLIFALPDENRFSLVDYSLHLPLQLLGVEKFLKVFFALLLEQKVVLESSHHDRLTTCVLAFTALCYPLQYLFTVIPLLPSSLKGAEQLLQAPSPYIIGLPRSFRDSRLSFHLPKDVLLVDLDTQELYGHGAQDPVPKLPQNEEKKLISQLNRILDGLNRSREESVEKKESGNRNDLTSISDLNAFQSLVLDLDEDVLNLAIRVAMVMFFKSPNVLGGFTEHTRTVRIYPRPVVAFQYERFIKSRPDPSPFTIVLAKTQAVEYFAEWALMPDNLVYQKVDDESLCLVEIGDKVKWFSDRLCTIPFHLWTERFDRGLLGPVVQLLFSPMRNNTVLPDSSVSKKTLSSTAEAREIAITSDSDTPTDVSASNGDSPVGTDAESPSDVESDRHAKSRIADIFDEMFEGEAMDRKSQQNGNKYWAEKLFSSVALSPSEKVECMQFGKELPSNLRGYYSPPTSFFIPDTNSQPPTTTTSSLLPQDSLSSRRLLKEVAQQLVSKGSANSCESPPQVSDSPELLPTSNSIPSTLREPTVNSPTLPRRTSSQVSQSPQHRSSKSALGAILDSWFADAVKSPDGTSDPVIEKQFMESEISENQRFISECIATIRKGNQPGMFSRRRLQKLMEEEVYRNSALALANMNVGHPVPKGQSHIDDVSFGSWDQYKAYVWLFTQIGVGIRQSCRPLTSTFIDSRGDVVSATGLAQALRDLFTSQAERDRVSHGGVCSSYCLLEMAHTHYHLLPKRRSVVPQQQVAPRRVTPTSHATSVPTSPKLPIEPIITPRFKSDSYVQDKGSISNSKKFFNVINTEKPTPSQPLSVIKQMHDFGQEEVELTASSAISMDVVEDVVSLAPFKSTVSLGYRYRHGRLLQMTSQVSPTVKTLPPCISVPALRFGLADQKSDNATGTASTTTTSEGKGEESEKRKTKEQEEIAYLKLEGLDSKIYRTYLFEEAMINSMDSKLWTNMQFWEDLFLDTVVQERGLLGMDFDPEGLLEHYSHLSPIARKHLELTEDYLLAGVMHNLIAFMVMARIPPDLVCRKIRRLIAKSHTGLHYTQKITQLLDSLEWLRGNDIDLLPIASRQFTPETFFVCPVWVEHPEMCTMEIYDEFLLIRSPDDSVSCRWWFDQIINVAYLPNLHAVAFQTRLNKKVEQFSFTADDPNSLFSSIASAISRARSKTPQGLIISQLGGRVNVVDAETNAVGELDLSLDGFRLTFGGKSQLIPLDQIKSCNIKMEDTFSFIVHGYDHDVVRTLKTDLASILLNQWQRLIALKTANDPRKAGSGATSPKHMRSRTSSSNNLEAFNQ
ncbi:MAP kinase-activating death domain protein [Taenia crassiceps]|uniref:MAP kinase-activating death domain protein n=1 Tax=Taenia crassiceps TaxID=6207 RepID=A0ABR4QUG9_9CEST